jgi:SAM-dependent methyltransferase
MEHRRIRDELASRRFRFLDAGCGSGGSLDHCERRFGRRPGLGVDSDAESLDLARRRGFAVRRGDLPSLVLPARSVDFTAFLDVLEHLPDTAAASDALRAAGAASRDFLFIRHPSFEDARSLAGLGLKLTWNDWSDHTNPMSIAELVGLIEGCGWSDYRVLPHMPIVDSQHPAILPLSAPRDTHEYDPMLHGPKPAAAFDPPIYGKFDVFVRLRPDLPDDEWRRIVEIEGWDAVWEPPSTKRMSDDDEHRRALARRRSVAADIDAVDLADSMLWRHVRQHPEPSPVRREILREILRGCSSLPWRHLLQLAHVLDAFNRTTDPSRVLGLGRGADLAAAYLAARFPRLAVTAADTGAVFDAFTLSNLRISASDAGAGQYDFVFVIDEAGPTDTIPDRWSTLVDRLSPGGWLCLALAGESLDGQTVQRCEAALSQCDYDRLESATIFSRRLDNAMEGLRGALAPPTSGRFLADLLHLALVDLEPGRTHGFREAGGLKFVLQRRAPDGTT